MSQLILCRVCLASDVTMYNILNSCLQEMYEKLTRLPLHADDGKPHTVCCICLRLLHSCYQLWVKSMTADRLLSRLLARGDELTEDAVKQIDRKEHRLTVCLSVTKQDVVHIEPLPAKDEVLVKEENVELKEEFTGFSSDTETRVSFKEPEVQSDSEDDVPLQAFSSLNKTVNNKKTDKEFLKGFKSGYARELLLTKEQQLQELTDRATSANYVNAPFKCELCCRGYVDATAFDNHKEKHDIKSGSHVCDVCHMRYKTPRKLRAHAVTAHERRYQCNSCAHRSHTAQAREHQKWHLGQEYVCRLCGHRSARATSHLTHLRARHRTRHVCARCGRAFVGQHGLRMHQAKAHKRDKPTDPSPPEERYCADCDIQFLSLLAWKKHMLSSINHAFGKGNNGVCVICGPACPGGGRHLKESLKALSPAKTTIARPATLTCEQCGSSFTNGSKLQAHVKRVHLGIKYNKNVVCETCGKKCTSNASLKYHQRTHTGEKPYACLTCLKRFADSNQLRIHTRRHTGERPYCCRHCRRTFTQKPALNRHYRVHTGAKPYSCQYCAKNFSQSNSLKLHIKTVHLKIPNKKRGPDAEKKEEVAEKLE